MRATPRCACGTSRRRFLLGLAAGAPLALSGCDDPLSLVSDEKVEAMGLEAWSRMQTEVPASRNAELQNTLARVSERLLFAAGETPRDWEVRAFAAPEAKAFVLSGRKIGVFEGMFRVAANPDQLAAVVGHEIGHLASNHAQDRISAQIAADVGLPIIARLLNLGEVEDAAEIAAALGIGAQVGLLLPYSRSHELEADAFGLRKMAAAGFAPREALELWRRMDAATGRRGLSFLQTHPAPMERIEAMEEILAQKDG
jgi:predicted Zn-dependent protease